MQPVLAQGVSCCVYGKPPKNYAVHVWPLGWSSTSSPSPTCLGQFVNVQRVIRRLVWLAGWLAGRYESKDVQLQVRVGNCPAIRSPSMSKSFQANELFFLGADSLKLYGSKNYGFVIMAKKLSINFYINWEYSTNYNRFAVNFKLKNVYRLGPCFLSLFLSQDIKRITLPFFLCHYFYWYYFYFLSLSYFLNMTLIFIWLFIFKYKISLSFTFYLILSLPLSFILFLSLMITFYLHFSLSLLHDSYFLSFSQSLFTSLVLCTVL